MAAVEGHKFPPDYTIVCKSLSLPHVFARVFACLVIFQHLSLFFELLLLGLLSALEKCRAGFH